MKSEFLDKGYIILEDVVSNSLINSLTDASHYYKQRTLHRQGNSGNVCYNLFRSDNILPDFILPELFNIQPTYDLIKSILGDGFILNELLLYFSLPDNDLQELHRDVNPLFPESNIEIPPYIVAVQYPINDFNSTSGGTRIIPGTHQNTSEPTRLENEKNILESIPNISKKDCVIRDCRTWHGAGKNNSSSPRAMFTLAFSKPWFGKKGNVSKDVYFSIDKEKRNMVSCIDLNTI